MSWLAHLGYSKAFRQRASVHVSVTHVTISTQRCAAGESLQFVGAIALVIKASYYSFTCAASRSLQAVASP